MKDVLSYYECGTCRSKMLQVWHDGNRTRVACGNGHEVVMYPGLHIWISLYHGSTDERGAAAD